MTEWPSLKATAAGNSLPNLELEDGSKFGQTRAIMHYLGAIYGYIP